MVARRPRAGLNDSTALIPPPQYMPPSWRHVLRTPQAPRHNRCYCLTNHEHGYRPRVGRYRVLFDANQEIRIVDVQEVKKRDDQTY